MKRCKSCSEACGSTGIVIVKIKKGYFCDNNCLGVFLEGRKIHLQKKIGLLNHSARIRFITRQIQQIDVMLRQVDIEKGSPKTIMTLYHFLPQTVVLRN